MSRTAKIQKLGNAIRRYRGLTRDKHWVHPPQYAAALDIARWCNALNIPVNHAIEKINAFASFDEFRAWMKTI